METILKDPCFRELQLAAEAALEYVPLTDMQYYIEAEEDPNIAKIKENNARVKSNVGDHIKKAINAIKVAIGNLLKKIANVFSKASMDKQTKEAYNVYLAAVKENPELKNEKISATDFKDSEKLYKQMLKETEEAERRIQAGERVDVSPIVNKWQNALADAGKGVATAVGAQTLLNMARSNRSMAMMISRGLNADSKIMEGLENQIGRENAEDLNKEVSKLSGSCALYRLRLKWHHKMYNNVAECFKGSIDGLKGAAIGKAVDRKALKSGKYGNRKEMDKMLRGNETLGRGMNARDDAFKTGKRELLKDKVRTTVTNPINRAKAEHHANSVARREAKGDYSQSDILSYINHNIDSIRKK